MPLSNPLAATVADISSVQDALYGAAGIAAFPAAATAVTPFTITSGNDTWGAWVQLLGSSDTPVVATHTKYDLHRLLVLVANQVSPYFIQIGFGTSGAAALAADTYSSTVINPASNTDKTEALPFMSRRQAAGTKAWMRCWCLGANAKTLTVMFGLHEYLV